MDLSFEQEKRIFLVGRRKFRLLHHIYRLFGHFTNNWEQKREVIFSSGNRESANPVKKKEEELISSRIYLLTKKKKSS